MLGKTLGHYRVGEQLGRGGMGEVYTADDLSLDRKVALKFLPDAFTGDPERMARFEREAKVLASLNHPNIAAIYGLEQAEGKRFIVMELVAGETLAQRLSKGALPIDDALGICKQIAEGLEAAHEKGVIHRDLKPANVMITEGDRVKILDFGLAKALSDESQSVDSSHSPTLTEAMTRPGVILGTAAYMSPEQAKGKSVDKRADIWAFGCILYECLTGKKIFEGETVTETLAAILKGEPDWQALPAAVPPAIRLVLRHCLEKDPRRRFGDVTAIRIMIEEYAAASSAGGNFATRQTGLWRIVVVALACLILGAVAAGIAVWRLKSKPVSSLVTKMSIVLPRDKELQRLGTVALTLSPDGSRLAYVCRKGSSQQICIRKMDSLETTPVAGTEGGANPFFSPNGKWLGFTANQKIVRVPITGGAPMVLADAAYPTCGISWGEKGRIVLSPSWGQDGFVEIPEEGGNHSPVVNLDSVNARWPQFLPGGQAILFTIEKWGSLESGIMVHSLKSGEQKVLIKDATSARYVPTGHLVYARGGNLFAVPFDPERLEIKGTQVSILEGIMESNEGGAQYSFSSNGSLAYVRGGLGGIDQVLVWVDRNGKEEPLEAPPRPYNMPRLSPDGERVAIQIPSNIFTYDIAGRRPLNRLTFKGSNMYPVWSPDGSRIAFRSDQEKGSQILVMQADGSGTAEPFLSDSTALTPVSWSPDGKSLVYMTFIGSHLDRINLFVLPLEKEGKPHRLFEPQEKGNQVFASFSPDGRWIAYESSETGQREIYVRPFPGPGGVWQVSTGEGHQPVWRESELFYLSGNKMMAHQVETTPTFKVLGVAKPLFETNSARELGYDVAPDGKRFLMIKYSDEESTTQIQYIANWFEELKQKAPAR